MGREVKVEVRGSKEVEVRCDAPELIVVVRGREALMRQTDTGWEIEYEGAKVVVWVGKAPEVSGEVVLGLAEREQALTVKDPWLHKEGP